MPPTIYFATDHAGFEMKQKLISFVRDVLGYEVVDCGAFTLDGEDDFTDFIAKAAREVSLHPKNSKAIILGGSGQGEAMLANRFVGVRAVVYYGGNEEIVRLSRTHNDANVLSLGARFVSFEETKKAVMLWLHTEHTPVAKYDRRIAKAEDARNENGAQKVLSQKSGLAHIHSDRPMQVSILPSLPATSFEELKKLCETLEGVALEIQVDIVDGIFVPHTSWPFREADPKIALLQLKTLTKNFSLEIDCMCMKPELYLDVFSEIGVKRVIIHAESTTQYEKCITHAREQGYKIGLAVLNSTNTKLFDTYATYFDFVQVMGIKKIGVQGQQFDENTLDTVRTLRAKYPRLEISIDGAVNESTILKLKEAGANRFAPGSAITKSSDPVSAYRQLTSLIGLS